MGHTFYSVYEHIVFSTKNRVACLNDNVQSELFPYMAASIRNHSCSCLIVGGHREHVHTLVLKSSVLLTGDLVKEIKRTSSIWIEEKGWGLDFFGWQSGYGSFSVSYSNVEAVKQYIAMQREHHMKMTWEDEFKLLLEKNGVQFDPRYYLD